MKKYYQMATPRHLQNMYGSSYLRTKEAALYRTYLQSIIYKTYEMPKLLAFANYVLHHVAVETLLMVIAIVVAIVLTIVIVIVMDMVMVIVTVIAIVIVLLHGCGEMAIIRYIIWDYKNETMSHQQQM
jgi:hypothetical protein